MKASCVEHPPSEPLIIIRKWQIDFCKGNSCAAALLSFFEQQEIIEERKPFNSKELEEGIMIYKREAITKAVTLLEGLGAIEISKNPENRYAFDNTRFFRFKPEVLNAWLQNRGRA